MDSHIYQTLDKPNKLSIQLQQDIGVDDLTDSRDD